MPDQIDPDLLFQALGDPTRRAILRRLVSGPCSVSALAAPLGITLTAVAQHLHVLEQAGLARTEKLGRTRTCTLAQPGFTTLEHWLRAHRPPLAAALDRLATLLDESP
jgi:DNA-binding transcriptional ArsR family regulator